MRSMFDSHMRCTHSKSLSNPRIPQETCYFSFVEQRKDVSLLEVRTDELRGICRPIKKNAPGHGIPRAPGVARHRSAVECRQRVAPRLLSTSASQDNDPASVTQVKQQGHVSHVKGHTRGSRHQALAKLFTKSPLPLLRRTQQANEQKVSAIEINRDPDNPKDSPTCEDRAQTERAQQAPVLASPNNTKTGRDALNQPTNPAGTRG